MDGPVKIEITRADYEIVGPVKEEAEKALSGLGQAKSEMVLNAFGVYFSRASEWEKKAKEIKVTDGSQKDIISMAREGRLILKGIRCDVENKRKDLKEESLREGKAIDGMANILKALIIPIESYLEEQETFVERKEKEEKDKLEEDRRIKLSEFVSDVDLYNLRDMSEEGFNQLLNSSKIARQKEKEAEDEAKRIKDEQEAENKRLLDEAKKKEEEDKAKDIIESKRREQLKPFVKDVTVFNLRDMTDDRFEEVLKVEKELFDREKAEKDEKERKDKVEKCRMTDLSKYVLDISVFNLRDMSDDDFNNLLSKSKKDFEDEEERKKKESDKLEADRKAAEDKKRKEYLDYKKKIGFTEETKDDFKEVFENGGITIWKKVGFFKAKDGR